MCSSTGVMTAVYDISIHGPWARKLWLENIEMVYLLFLECWNIKSGIFKRLGPVLVNSSMSDLESKSIIGEWKENIKLFRLVKSKTT